MEDCLPALSDLKITTKSMNALYNKVDNLENRFCRNNICLVGVPERAEGCNPVSFFESWLANIFGKEKLSPLFAIEQAHRVSTEIQKK